MSQPKIVIPSDVAINFLQKSNQLKLLSCRLYPSYHYLPGQKCFGANRRNSDKKGAQVLKGLMMFCLKSLQWGNWNEWLSGVAQLSAPLPRASHFPESEWDRKQNSLPLLSPTHACFLFDFFVQNLRPGNCMPKGALICNNESSHFTPWKSDFWALWSLRHFIRVMTGSEWHDDQIGTQCSEWNSFIHSMNASYFWESEEWAKAMFTLF